MLLDVITGPAMSQLLACRPGGLSIRASPTNCRGNWSHRQPVWVRQGVVGRHHDELKCSSGQQWPVQGMSPQVFKKSDLTEVLWSVAPAGGLLRIRQNDKVTVNFHGFAKSDEGRLKDALSSRLDTSLMSQPMHLSGHNWGSVKVLCLW